MDVGDDDPGSGRAERDASMTRQMPFEPLPASVLFAIGGRVAHFGRIMIQEGRRVEMCDKKPGWNPRPLMKCSRESG